MREALNGRPETERTRREYQHVINAYRQVYYAAPASTKADPSVVAVAELMVEMGRRFDDEKTLRSAIGQYEFLRREYPGSRYRFEALFTIGEIYKNDLGDPARAKSTFEEFLRRYPRHHLAEQARAALAEPMQQAALRSKEAADSAQVPATQVEEHAPAKEIKSSERKSARVTGIRHWSTPDYTRVAVDLQPADLEQEMKFESQRIDGPDRLVFDLSDARLASTLAGKTFDVDDGFLKKIRVAQFQPGKTRIVLEVNDLSSYNAFLLPNPARLIIDIHGDSQGKQTAQAATAKPTETGPAAATLDATASKPLDKELTARPESVASTSPKKTIVEAEDDDVTVAKSEPPEIKPVSKSSAPASEATGPASPERKLDGDATKTSKHRNSRSKKPLSKTGIDAREARPTAQGDRSLIRALGLKIGKIVIDPGHGGHDTGTIGPNGLEEKDLVLEVGRRLGKLLEARMGAEVVYTRSDDTFIPLETRTAIANQEQADLFISIHANSSRDPDARGVETYYLNFTSSADALDVAARENAVSENSIHELQDLVKKIALKDKIDESREFATDVQRSLHNGLAAKSPGVRDRGVKKAPFIVLIGANMPSILAEISFVSNPGDERRLETAEYRQRIAESLYRGIAKYVSGLSGVKVASKIDKGEGQ